MINNLLSGDIINLFLYVIHITLPFIAFYILYNCIISLRDHRRPKQPLITLVNLANGDEIPILYWENSIGRVKSCDIILTDPTVSRNHAVLYRREKGWIIKDTGSHGGTEVNNVRIRGDKVLEIGDVITFGCTAMSLQKAEMNNIKSESWFFKSNLSKNAASPLALLFFTTIFQAIGFLELALSQGEFNYEYFIPFAMLNLINYSFFIVTKTILKRTTFEIENVVLFLCGIGVMIISGVDLNAAYTQIITMVIGIVFYCFMIAFLRDPDIVMKWRFKIFLFAVALLALNLLIGTTLNGSKNWIMIGPVSIQPSEFVKIALVLVGTSTLVRLQTAKNLTGFIIFSGICIGALFLMGDFGTACIFFLTFIVISFMRSGDLRTIALIIAAAVFAVFIILQFKPYIAERFASWGHAFEYVETTGYQPANVLTYVSSGGLFGFGLGKGNLADIFASYSDLVFGMICEELGILLAIVVVLIFPALAFYSRALSEISRCTLYSIGACAVGGMFVFQAALNIFGATDILPITGVTLPFVSAGGSSMISSWALLAFIKAADERTYAIHTIK